MPIVLEGVSHVYDADGPWRVEALKNVNLEIGDGEFLGLIGATGSGKSTLIQHLNGLLKPTEGRVLVDGVDPWKDKGSRKEIRQKVGLVFQYPEHQLFEETVFDDVAFGPRNLGLAEPEVKERVREALNMVGLPSQMASRSPFELSGGEMRRVAIAGVLAMKPRVLVLDEPAAGLDPRGRRDILERVRRLHDTGLTVVLASHSMEDVARLADRIAVVAAGMIAMAGPPVEIFQRGEELGSLGLEVPQATSLMKRLSARGKPVRTDVMTIEQAREEILRHLRPRGRRNENAGRVF